METAISVSSLLVLAIPLTLFITLTRYLRKRNNALVDMLGAKDEEEFIDRAEGFLETVYLPKRRFMSALLRPSISLPSKEEPDELIDYIRYHYMVDRRTKYSSGRIEMIIIMSMFIIGLGALIFGFTAGVVELHLLIIFLMVIVLLVASAYLFREFLKEYHLLDRLEERCKEIRG